MKISSRVRWGLGLGSAALLITGMMAKSLYDQAKTSADAYLFGYPLVLMELTKQYQHAKTQQPINSIRHLRRFPDASFNSVVAPNVDTLYSVANLDLRNEPVVLHIPQSNEHFFMLPMLDAWTNVFVSPGTRTTGFAAHSYLITGPGWQGKVPEGLERIQAPTPMVWIIGRVKSSGPADYAQINAFQDQLQLQPLSAWQGQPGAPVSLPMLELPFLDSQRAPDQQLEQWNSAQFFTTLCRLIAINPPRAEDAPMLQRMRDAGLLTDNCASKLTLPMALATERGYRRVIAGLHDIDKVLAKQQTYNGWRMSKVVGEYGTQYLQRAAVAKIGLGANLREDAVYPYVRLDSRGRPLDGAQRYRLHFDKAQLPPVRGFWSLTLYNQAMFFVDNPINRYAIGDRDALHYNPDGSLDLYVQPEAPQDPAQKDNWLPSKSGPTALMLRLYWPEQSALDFSWLPPAVERLE